ncbi:hypothetical protein K505DRAFT_239613, partial [Melanomma pulvis-pyrius CBS 109.77]
LVDCGSLVLVKNNSSIRGAYTALSYCWGEAQGLSTMVHSYDQLTTCFTISERPQTLQDAILIKMRLGVQKVWINALCII